MKLNKTQTDYAIRRLNDNIQARLTKEAGPAPANLNGDFKALAAALASKKTKLKPNLEKVLAESHWARDCIRYVFDLDPSFNKEYTDWVSKKEKISKELEVKRQKIADQLHLSGDAETALKLIESI